MKAGTGDRCSSGVAGQLALWFVVGLGATLRLVPLLHGLPAMEARPDETIALYTALRMGTGNLNPGDFHWPTLYPTLLSLWLGALAVLGWLVQAWTSLSALYALVHSEPWIFLAGARVLSACFGILSLPLLHRIGCKLHSERAGLLAALILAVAPLHVRQSHAAVPDVLLIYLLLQGFSTLLALRAAPSLRLFLAVGAWLGLAAGTKYNGAFLLFPLLVVCGSMVTGVLSKYRLLLWLSLSELTALGVFTLSTPYWLLDFPQFFADASHEISHLSQAHLGIYQGAGLTVHLGLSLRYGLGEVPLVLALAAFARALRRSAPSAALWSVLPLAYLLLTARAQTTFFRHALPALPFLAMGAGIFLADAFAWLRSGSYHLPAWLLGVLLLLATCWPSFQRSAAAALLLQRPDSRILLAAEVSRRFGEVSRIGFAGNYYARPLLDARLQLVDFSEMACQLSSNPAACVLPPAMHKGGLEVQTAKDGGAFDGSQWGHLPAVVVVERSPLEGYSRQSGEVEYLLRQHYRRVTALQATRPSLACRAVYDQQDAFYLPISGFCGVLRPGPSFELWSWAGPNPVR